MQRSPSPCRRLPPQSRPFRSWPTASPSLISWPPDGAPRIYLPPWIRSQHVLRPSTGAGSPSRSPAVGSWCSPGRRPSVPTTAITSSGHIPTSSIWSMRKSRRPCWSATRAATVTISSFSCRCLSLRAPLSSSQMPPTANCGWDPAINPPIGNGPWASRSAESRISKPRCVPENSMPPGPLVPRTWPG